MRSLPIIVSARSTYQPTGQDVKPANSLAAVQFAVFGARSDAPCSVRFMPSLAKILQIISWQIFISGVDTKCSLKWMDIVHPLSQSNVREPGENPGRLRHCNGYKFPRATAPLQACMSGGGKAGRRFEAEVRISVWLCSSAPEFGALLRQREG